MDRSDQFDAILALGRKLVDELGQESQFDTLGRWMAHYVAELIVKSGHEGDEAARSECFRTILALWDHRSVLPNGKRPFEDIEPVIRTLERLDPENKMPWGYCQPRWPVINGAVEGEDAEHYLKLVESIDRTARILIGHLAAQAGAPDIADQEELVNLAGKAGLESEPHRAVLDFMKNHPGFSAEPEKEQNSLWKLRDQLKSIEEVSAIVTEYADFLRSKIKSLENKDAPNSAL